MAAPHPSGEQLSGYIDRVLARKDAAAIAEHLQVCADCSGRVHLLRATSQAVASLPEEELPRPLDFGFLRQGVSSGETGPRGFAARVIYGRPPTWLPTMVAAAAVLALVITWAPRLLPAGGNQPQSSAGSAALSRTQGGGLSPQAGPQGAGPALGLNTSNPGALSVVPPGVPNSFQGTLEKNAIGRDGSTITLLSNPASAKAGQPVQLLLRVVGGPHGTDLASPGMEIIAAAGQNHLRLGGSEGTSRTLKPGEELDLTLAWSAGAVTGPPAPGGYSLIGRVFLKNSPVVEVPLTFTVSS